MPIGILGQKKYMTQLFMESGEAVPVTVVSCPQNIIDQIKTIEADGYSAVRLSAFPKKKPTKTNTHYVKKEIRIQGEELKKGDMISLENFKDVKDVKVVGIAKGKGFAGVIKRHHFSGGPGAHGSKFHRQPGSVGTRKPERTVKGKKLPGRMGGQQITLLCVPVIKVDVKNGLIALKGSIPGARNSYIKIIAN